MGKAKARKITPSMMIGVIESGLAFAELDALRASLGVPMERLTPKKPRVANAGVLAVRVANLGQRDALLAADSKKFFTEPHYAGFPAVLVRLAEVSAADLKVLLAEAWRCQAPADPAKPAKRATRAKRSK